MEEQYHLAHIAPLLLHSTTRTHLILVQHLLLQLLCQLALLVDLLILLCVKEYVSIS